eukprot:14131883-Alexandrium_andersonii.AAC.1
MHVRCAISRVSRSRVSRFRAQNMRQARTGRGTVPESIGSEAQEGPFAQRAAPIAPAARAAAVASKCLPGGSEIAVSA